MSCKVSVKSMTVLQAWKKEGKDGLKTYKIKTSTKDEEQNQDLGWRLNAQKLKLKTDKKKAEWMLMTCTNLIE